MIFVLSPAKSLDYDPPATEVPHTPALFTAQSAELIGVLKEKSPLQIATLMDLSDALSGLNVARYQAWRPRATQRNAKQAVLAFNGDVYDGLDAKSLDVSTLNWLQAHLCILSGLYGVLRPLDLMQAYRLEMGTALVTPRGKNLYQFWGVELSKYLDERQCDEAAPVLVNLASQEYFKAVDKRALKTRVVDCVFQDFKSGQFKIISFFAKRARGLMMRYAAVNRCTSPEQLQAFDLDGYAFAPDQSSPERLVFRRALPA
jgi:cytoplasmic iron level regulating protein YaaA (DUF328/UPF0246 family)